MAKQGADKQNDKSKSLRPLRITLAVLTVILVILILDKLPTRKTYTVRKKTTTEDTSQLSEADSDHNYYYVSDLLDTLESDLENRLKSLGVPESEYQNLSEYLSKDEIFEIETKVTLASSLEENVVYATPEEIAELRTIFRLDKDYPFTEVENSEAPTEYKNLAELLEKYHKTLTTTEDYDIIEEA